MTNSIFIATIPENLRLGENRVKLYTKLKLFHMSINKSKISKNRMSTASATGASAAGDSAVSDSAALTLEMCRDNLEARVIEYQVLRDALETLAGSGALERTISPNCDLRVTWTKAGVASAYAVTAAARDLVYACIAYASCERALASPSLDFWDRFGTSSESESSRASRMYMGTSEIQTTCDIRAPSEIFRSIANPTSGFIDQCSDDVEDVIFTFWVNGGQFDVEDHIGGSAAAKPSESPFTATVVGVWSDDFGASHTVVSAEISELLGRFEKKLGVPNRASSGSLTKATRVKT